MGNATDKILISFAVLVFCLPFVASDLVAIQVTGSLARGIYIESEINGRLKPGDIVSVSFRNENIAERPNVYPPPTDLRWHSFIKVIAGIPGDRIDITEDKLFINGVYAGPIHSQDSKGRPLSRAMTGRYFLQKDWYFVTTPHNKSYDSRYLGPVHLSQLKIATPLWLLPTDTPFSGKGGIYGQR
jgi:conjugative transfer signal peptidase TraF